MNEKNICCKRINLNGEIERNMDSGFGFTIAWQSDFSENNNEKNGATPIDVLNALINELKFIEMSKYKDEKYKNASLKLIEALR